ncbi:MAG: acyltransferase family protein [Anaerovoracaceae bacterium]|jgi:fucose 4-O-acetylase-like acetyltransferase
MIEEAGGNTMSKDKARNHLFDNIKALLIFSVVYAHYHKVNGDFSVDSLGGIIYITSFSYIMQGFLFVSGYFSKNVAKCRQTSVQMFLLPYFVLMIFMYGVRYLLNGYATINFFIPTMALWYLLVMFYYRFFIKDISKIPYILPISFAISLLAGFVPFLGEKIALGRTFGFLPFFMLGYFSKQEHIDKIRKIPKPALIILLSGLLGFSVFLSKTGFMPIGMLYLKRSYMASGVSPWQGLLMRLLIIIVSCCWILVFIGLTTEKRNFLSTIGENTMAVYVFHIIIRYVIQRFGLPGGGTFVIYVLTFLAAAASVYLLGKKPVESFYNKIMEGISNLFKFFLKKY